MTIPRVFSPAEVDALIPELTERVRDQLQRQSVIEEALAELARHAGGLPRTLDADPDDDSETSRLKEQLRQRISEYETGWLAVQAMGAIVKDPQIGLLDFYGHVNGELVWLCWRYGEESLRYWHSLESGYAGRRPLRRQAGDRIWN